MHPRKVMLAFEVAVPIVLIAGNHPRQ